MGKGWVKWSKRVILSLLINKFLLKLPSLGLDFRILGHLFVNKISYYFVKIN